MLGGKTCSDFGGKKHDGTPCTRPAGWGVKGTNTGPCKNHCQAEAEKQNAIKAAFLEKIQDPLMSKEWAAIHCGSSVTAIWRMRQADPEFDAEITRIHKANDPLRLEAVEDSLFCRIVEGKAAASETLFWLMNRAPDRWQDKRYMQHSIETDPLKALAKIIGIEPDAIPE